MGRFLVLLGILLSIVGVQLVSAQALPDVVGTTYEPAFNYLQNKNVVEGINGAGKPNQLLTRVEALKVLLELQPKFSSRITWYKKHITPLPLFTDIDNTKWYAPYIETAYEASIVDGYPDQTFKPGRALTVAEAVKLAVQTLSTPSVNTNALSSPHIQNVANQWFTPSVNAAIEHNAIGPGLLKLEDTITRGQFFEIAYRLATLQETNALVFQEPVINNANQIAVNINTGSSNTINNNSNQVQSERSSTVTQPGNSIGNNTNNAIASNIVRRDTQVSPQAGVTINVSPPTTSNGSNIITTSDNSGSDNWGKPAADHEYGSQKPFAITMPTLGIFDLTITHPTDATNSQSVLEVLNYGVGHLFSYPGNNSKIMVYGHSSNYAWVRNAFTEAFSRINELNPGDLIYVTLNGYVYTYQVEHEKIISPSDTSDFVDDGSGEALVLYTCWPKYSVAERYVVITKPYLL